MIPLPSTQAHTGSLFVRLRGGTGENRRITFRAAEGEEVNIKGSESITSWKPENGKVWKVEIPNGFFGTYSPYAINIGGSAFKHGGWHHCGDVYLDGEAFYEKQTAEELSQSANTWHCLIKGETTVIRANFGDADPNERLSEINVRETLFWPVTTGLRFITVSGFDFRHAAANWAGHMEPTQMAAVGPMMGKHWIIENCKVTHARAVGIGIGWAPGVDLTDIGACGDHIVRNNIVRRCGQMGIGGKRGAPRSRIYGNLIEETNCRREFGGDETAGIKLMHTVDTIVRDNLIRGVYSEGNHAAFGLWMDYSNQGLRLSRNIVYGTETQAVFLEMNHGPILVDNNIIIGPNGFSNLSEATVMAHNLFVNCSFYYSTDPRQSPWSPPHTLLQPQKGNVILREDKFFNNIFIKKGLAKVKGHPGYEADFNAYLQVAEKSTFGDENSIVDGSDAEFLIKEEPLGVELSFRVPENLPELHAPVVDSALVGTFTTTGQTIQDRTGTPVSVDTDFNGKTFVPVRPGPLADPKPGGNTLSWHYSKIRK